MGIFIGNTSYIVCNECKTKSENAQLLTNLIVKLKNNGWFSNKDESIWFCQDCKGIIK